MGRCRSCRIVREFESEYLEGNITKEENRRRKREKKGKQITYKRKGFEDMVS